MADRFVAPSGFADMPEAWQRIATGDYGESGLNTVLRQVMALVRRNIWLVVGILGLCLGLALAATMLATPRYLAETNVQINDQRDRVLSEDADATGGSSNDWDVDRFLNTQIEILKSRGLAERVARKLDLGASERFYAGFGVKLPDAETTDAERRELVLDLLQSNLKIELLRQTRIVKIGFLSTDGELSAQIANGFAEEFIQANLQRRFDSSAYARNFVSGQLEDARVRLEESERELNNYARQAGLIRTRNTDSEEGMQQGSVVTSSLMQLNEEANRAQAARVAAEARWQAEQGVPLLSSRAVQQSSAVQELMKDEAKLASQLSAARERYFPEHPQVIRLTDELKAVRAELDGTARQIRESVRAEFVAAQQAEVRLRDEVSRLEGATMAEQDRAVRYNTLAREADTNRSLYDGLLQRYRELNAAAGISTSNISIIDKADPPRVPYSPSLIKNLAIGLILGLGVAGFILFLRSQLDDVVRVPDDVEAKAHLPLLGVIPKSPSANPAEDLDDPRSPVSEAYNSLRGTLLFSSREGLPRTMLFTSVQPTEGKSTSSLAIARSLARMGKKTVIIDADLRRPTLHSRSGVSNDRGLSSLLVSGDAVESAITPAEQPNLSIMPSGPIPPSPTELLTSPRMAAVLETLAQRFDCVIIDSPPVLGLADAPVLSALADGVVLVIESGRGRSGPLKAAIRRLKAMDPVLLGAVLTKYSPSKAGGASSDYYGYEYYRYEGGSEA